MSYWLIGSNYLTCQTGTAYIYCMESFCGALIAIKLYDYSFGYFVGHFHAYITVSIVRTGA